MKTCNQCQKVKPVEEFNKNKSMKDGRLNTCRECRAIARRASGYQYQRDWAKTPRGRYNGHKSRAKERGIPWGFTFETWWQMWEPHWDNRGRGSEELCMCRDGDTGPYSPENCRIDTSKANIQEAWAGRY